MFKENKHQNGHEVLAALPANFCNHIARVFGKPGEIWIKNLPQIINQCQEQWHLTNITIASDLSYNLVCFAESPDFGPVALKVGVPNPEIYTEITALTLYQGQHICTCHAADKELGALLLERVMPGNDLDTLESTAQLTIAAELIASLPVPIEETHGLPAYADWISRAFARARREDQVGPVMLDFIAEAETRFRKLEALERPKVLLHGDLHHKNILQTANGRWKAIDPKGVIGCKYLEPARFMENHLERPHQTNFLQSLEEMTTTFSTYFAEPSQVIADALFVDTILSTCWSFEEQPDPAWVEKALHKCELILQYVRTLS